MHGMQYIARSIKRIPKRRNATLNKYADVYSAIL